MFQLDVNQNPFVVKGTTRMDAVLAVTASADAPPLATGPAVLGLVLDGSGSMRGAVLQEAKAAAKRVVELLDADTSFFVVAFSSSPDTIAPLALATPENKAAAARAIDERRADGGTMFSSALRAARAEVAKVPGARASVIFLTDGKNNGEDNHELPRALAECEGVFQADCRGVGTDWEPDQLRTIADRLLGTAAIVADASGLEADFRDSLARAAGRSVAAVRLRIQLPRSGKVRLVSLKQTSPQILELTAQGVAIDGSTTDYSTGAWAPGESRDFHVAFEMLPGAVGDEMMLCRPSVVFGRSTADPEIVRGRPVIAAWTLPGDERSALLNSHVAHYTGQVKLAEDIREGLSLRAAGRSEQATVLLGRALASARASGNAVATAKLQEIVVEEGDGSVRLRPNVAKALVMDLDLASVITTRAPRRDAS